MPLKTATRIGDVPLWGVKKETQKKYLALTFLDGALETLLPNLVLNFLLLPAAQVSVATGSGTGSAVTRPTALGHTLLKAEGRAKEKEKEKAKTRTQKRFAKN